MSTFQHINNNTGVRNLGQKLILVCNSIKLYVKELLIANRTFTISSGTDFHTNWKIFKTNVKNELSNLNIKRQTLKLIKTIPSPSLKNNFNQNIDRIAKKIEYQKLDSIKCIMGELATKEMENIIKDVKGESTMKKNWPNILSWVKNLPTTVKSM